MNNPNRDLIAQFSILYDHYKKIKDKGRTISYSKIVSILKGIDEPIVDVKQVKGIRGLGQGAQDKIYEYLTTGKIAVVEEIKSTVSPATKKEQILESLEKVHGIGKVGARKFYVMGIRSVKQLAGKQELLTSQQKLGIKYYVDFQKRIPRKNISRLKYAMMYILGKKFGPIFDMVIAGSYRRGTDTSGDIDCIISPKIGRTTEKFSLNTITKELQRCGIVVDILSMRGQKMMGVARCPGDCEDNYNMRLDIEFLPPEEFWFGLLYFTGSKNFNMNIRGEAKRQGLLLNEHGLYDVKTGKRAMDTPTCEKDIFDAIGVKYVDPERR